MKWLMLLIIAFTLFSSCNTVKKFEKLYNCPPMHPTVQSKSFKMDMDKRCQTETDRLIAINKLVKSSGNKMDKEIFIEELRFLKNIDSLKFDDALFLTHFGGISEIYSEENNKGIFTSFWFPADTFYYVVESKNTYAHIKVVNAKLQAEPFGFFYDFTKNKAYFYDFNLTKKIVIKEKYALSLGNHSKLSLNQKAKMFICSAIDYFNFRKLKKYTVDNDYIASQSLDISRVDSIGYQFPKYVDCNSLNNTIDTLLHGLTNTP